MGCVPSQVYSCKWKFNNGLPDPKPCKGADPRYISFSPEIWSELARSYSWTRCAFATSISSWKGRDGWEENKAWLGRTWVVPDKQLSIPSPYNQLTLNSGPGGAAVCNLKSICVNDNFHWDFTSCIYYIYIEMPPSTSSGLDCGKNFKPKRR